jgi:hypothetical protein
MYEELLDLRNRVLGADDSDTLETQHEIALLLANQDKFEAAEEIFRDVYQKRKEALGLQDEDTLESVSQGRLTRKKKPTVHVQGNK